MALVSMRAGSFCTPRLREELSKLSLPAFYSVCEINGFTESFWILTSTIIEMLYDRVSRDYLCCGEMVTNKSQNLSEHFPHLITDLPTVCFDAFQKSDPDQTLTLLVYKELYFHTLRVEASNVAVAFPPHYIEHQLHRVVKTIVITDPQRHKLEFTGQHYVLVALYFIYNDLLHFQR